MSLFRLFKKKSEGKVEENEPRIPDEIRYKCIDKIDYQFESALEAYCSERDTAKTDLNDDDFDEINRLAGKHIGFFMTWIIQNHLEGDIHKDNEDALKNVRNGSLLGVDFVIKYCGNKFWGVDVCDDIFDFVNSYYDQYLQDYTDWVLDTLFDLPLEFVGTYEDYNNFKNVIDSAYKNYLNK